MLADKENEIRYVKTMIPFGCVRSFCDVEFVAICSKKHRLVNFHSLPVPLLLKITIVFSFLSSSTDHQRVICLVLAPFSPHVEWKITIINIHDSSFFLTLLDSRAYFFSESTKFLHTHSNRTHETQKNLTRQSCMYKHTLIRANKKERVITWKMLGNWMNLLGGKRVRCCAMVLSCLHFSDSILCRFKQD